MGFIADKYDSSATLKALVAFAIAEDVSDIGDVTSDALIPQDALGDVAIVSRQKGIVSGLEAFSETIKYVDPAIEIEYFKNDGETVEPSEKIAVVKGSLKSVLLAERTSLNFLQHLSGIATLTNEYVQAVRSVGSETVVRDTRKTLPGYRTLEKQAVLDGGGENHRRGLYDAFLVKDNHIAKRDLEIIAKRCRDFNPDLPLEIEVDSLEQLKTVIAYDPDVILLDNFDVEDVYKAIDLAKDFDLEISGGITLENIASYALTNVKYIAIGAITHSAPALDIGFDI